MQAICCGGREGKSYLPWVDGDAVDDSDASVPPQEAIKSSQAVLSSSDHIGDAIIMRIADADGLDTIWDCVSEEGLEEFLDAMGFNWIMQKVAKAVVGRPTLVFVRTATGHIEKAGKDDVIKFDLVHGKEGYETTVVDSKGVKVAGTMFVLLEGAQGETLEMQTVATGSTGLKISSFLRRTMLPDGTLRTDQWIEDSTAVRILHHRRRTEL
jgi:hypothetical protein